MILESVSTSNFIAEKFVDFWDYTGFANFEWANLIMIAVGAFFIWLAIIRTRIYRISSYQYCIYPAHIASNIYIFCMGVTCSYTIF